MLWQGFSLQFMSVFFLIQALAQFWEHQFSFTLISYIVTLMEQHLVCYIIDMEKLFSCTLSLFTNENYM